MPVAWTESETLRLVILYSNRECLWNPLHPNFKNKLSRYKAYKKIVDCMNVCGLTVYDCIKRITYVKTQYCYELSKISAAIASEKFYKPTVSWFPIIHQLFFPFITHDCIDDVCKPDHDQRDEFNDCYCEKSIKRLNRSTSIEVDAPGKECECPYANCQCDNLYITRARARSKNLWIRTEDEELTDKERLRSHKANQIDIKDNSKRSINTEHAAQTDTSWFKTACSTCQACLEDRSVLLNSDSKDIDSLSTEEDSKGKKNIYDEFDMFGKSIAFQLRNINFETAIKLEKCIQDLIAQERLGNMKSKCTKCCNSSNCSECKVLCKDMVCSCGLPVIMIKTDQSCELNCRRES